MNIVYIIMWTLCI